MKLFKAAASAHQGRIRTAMCGNGVDRHLIGMRVVAKATGTETGEVFNGTFTARIRGILRRMEGMDETLLCGS